MLVWQGIVDQSDAVTQNAWFRCALCAAISGEISILRQTGAESWGRFPVPRISLWESMSIMAEENFVCRDMRIQCQYALVIAQLNISFSITRTVVVNRYVCVSLVNVTISQCGYLLIFYCPGTASPSRGYKFILVVIRGISRG